MRRPAVLVTVALVVATVAAVPQGGLATAGTGVGPPQPSDDEFSTETAPAPGEQLSGVLEVWQAELDGQLDSRTFGIEIARAENDGATAEVLSEQLAAVEARKAALERVRENGSLSRGAYATRIAGLAAELRAAERLANESGRVAEELPGDLVATRGVDRESIPTLRDRASELADAFAELARTITGPAIGTAPGRAGSGDRSPP